MNILHIVTLMTPDGTYGGPARVAINQSVALQDRGHSVEILAAAAGYSTPPTEIGGVRAQLFARSSQIPDLGFASVFAPGVRSWIDANAARFDIIHIHFGRHLLTIPAAFQLRRLGIPYLCQTHGMVAAHSHRFAATIDRLWTAKALQRAAAVLCINERERRDVIDVAGPDCNYHLLPNGVPEPTNVSNTATDLPEVLFLARLHRRKHPEIFAEAALTLLRRGIKGRFCIVGPPGGAERAVDDIIATARREGFGPDRLVREPAIAPEHVNARISRATVYVLPAVNEPFGLTITEALAVGVPAVICDDGGLAPFVERHRCGLTISGGTESVVDAVDHLLSHPIEAAEMGRRGSAAVRTELSNDAVTARLVVIYRTVRA